MAQANILQQGVLGLARVIDDAKGILQVGLEDANVRPFLFGNPGQWLGALVSSARRGLKRP